MKFAAIFSSLAFASLVAAQTLSYDNIYDDAGASLSVVACSDGENGLLTKGYSTFGSLPPFPHVGGVPAVAGWNSPSCGTCWAVTYTNAAGATRSINILAIDVGGNGGFVISQAAMDDLTGGQAIALGRIDVSSEKVDNSACGV